MQAFGNVFYSPGNSSIWTGRNDGETSEFFRWHQVVDCIDLNAELISLNNHFVFLGFCCDEGVKRNQGRVGAKDAPETLRRVLAGLPNHKADQIKLVDAGDVICIADDMEAAQQELSTRVTQILELGGMPIVLGGGHEVTYGHFNGLKKQHPQGKLGIINLDAHFDIRPLKENQGNSGTGFFQIFEDAQTEGHEVRYMAIGIQDISNTKALFQYAEEHAVKVIKGNEINAEHIEQILMQIQQFADEVDAIYVTVDMDVFAAGFAPGVSAPAFNGIIPDATFAKMYNSIIDLTKVKSIDFAEINPLYDIDNRTTKLAADLIFRLVNNKR